MVVHRRSAGARSERAEYSATLARVARYALAHKVVVVGAWLAVGVVLALAFPQLETVVRQQSVDPIPAGVPSFQAFDRMGTAFGEKGAKTTVFIAMENRGGLTPTVRVRYDELVQKLRGATADVASVRDLVGDPTTASQAVSRDGTAWYLPVGLTGTLGGPAATRALDSVRDLAYHS
ncbi:MMPL family transporter, partial [Tsukamurella pulmonis]